MNVNLAATLTLAISSYQIATWAKCYGLEVMERILSNGSADYAMSRADYALPQHAQLVLIHGKLASCWLLAVQSSTVADLSRQSRLCRTIPSK